MKKIFFLILFFSFFWLSYECIEIYHILSKRVETRGNLILYDRKWEILADIHEGGYMIPYTGSLDTRLVRYIVEIEDRRFYEHWWMDIIGKLGALRENYDAGAIVRGGSTITEQYIKNTYFPKEKRSWEQKLRESLWAVLAEVRYSKEEILTKYLDSVYMGNGVYGIWAAASLYFSTSWENLSDDAIIEIIARIHSPNLEEDDPYIERISLRLFAKTTTPRITEHSKFKNRNLFPLFTERIEKEIDLYCRGRENKLLLFVREIPGGLCEKEKKELFTTIDKNLASSLEESMEGMLRGLEEKNIHNGAIYIFSEKEGKILAYIGNRKNGQDNAIDMIEQKRSVGSVLKPIIYKLALERGADGESYILDDTKVYQTEESEKGYIPENYIPKSYGPIRLKEALGNSLNSATVRLAEHIGIGRIYDRFKQYGIVLDHEAGYYGYGIALGAPEVSLEEVVRAYGYLSNREEKENFILTDILRDEKNRARTFGISSILNTSIPLAVKTGTSTDFRDNWAVAYDEHIIIGVWVGNSDGSSMNDVSWVTGAGPLFHQVAEKLIYAGYIETGSEQIPEWLEEALLCLDRWCFQKERVLIEKNHIIKSRPKNNFYSVSDFITPLTNEEKKKWKIE